MGPKLKDHTDDDWMFVGQEAGWRVLAYWQPDARIANPPPALLAKYTVKEKKFFGDYADFVLRIIRDGSVSERVRRIISIENLRIERPVDIRVMMFPARQLRGMSNRTLHGSYSHSASQISLYPMKIPREYAKNDGQGLFTTSFDGLSDRKKRLLYEIAHSAVSTLVHELLHVKFESRGLNSYAQEALVRKLEAKYMMGWESTLLMSIRNALPG
ncbi:MAG TPA: hypothetical protein VFV92_06685 [Candidatus Bathyarchaeia archaeon]|nr:hypothetical protein [Candidatus Bathyarchaeia archaeon]